MRYTLLLHYGEMAEGELPPEVAEQGQIAMGAYATTLQNAGVLISAEVLQFSDMTTTLRKVDGALQIQDGPYAATKEQLGGTFVIDVADLDEAIRWAGQVPALDWQGTVELRPGGMYTVDGVWQPNK